MARYQVIGTHPRLLPVNLAAQLLPGTFEYAIGHLLDHAIDLSRFDGRSRSDTTGAPACSPAVLLKVVLCACGRGIVSGPGADCAHVFAVVLAVCDQQGCEVAPLFRTASRGGVTGSRAGSEAAAASGDRKQ